MVNIVGAGLAGSILKHHLDNLNIPCIIIDCEKEWRASNKSENLFSKTWSKTLGDDVVKNGIELLQSIVNIETIAFKTKAGINNTLYVPIKNILISDYIKDEIIKIEQEGCYSKDKFYPGMTIICTGYWARKYIEEKMIGLTGQGLIFEGTWNKEPIMNFVSPYVHQKIFQLDTNRIWYGDSTCIQYGSYIAKQDEYVIRCKQRAEVLGLINPISIEYGIRPWVKGFKGYLKRYENIIVNTGGWKCGIVIYSNQAKIIGEWIQKST